MDFGKQNEKTLKILTEEPETIDLTEGLGFSQNSKMHILLTFNKISLTFFF